MENLICKMNKEENSKKYTLIYMFIFISYIFFEFKKFKVLFSHFILY